MSYLKSNCPIYRSTVFSEESNRDLLVKVARNEREFQGCCVFEGFWGYRERKRPVRGRGNGTFDRLFSLLVYEEEGWRSV